MEAREDNEQSKNLYVFNKPMKIKVKQLRDVVCPYCDGEGEIDIGTEEYSHYIKCLDCDGKGQIEVEVEYCQKCGEELEWNEMEFGFDEETETIYRCPNKCELKNN